MMRVVTCHQINHSTKHAFAGSLKIKPRDFLTQDSFQVALTQLSRLTLARPHKRRGKNVGANEISDSERHKVQRISKSSAESQSF
jgi:hypothetical protein